MPRRTSATAHGGPRGDAPTPPPVSHGDEDSDSDELSAAPSRSASALELNADAFGRPADPSAERDAQQKWNDFKNTSIWKLKTFNRQRFEDVIQAIFANPVSAKVRLHHLEETMARMQRVGITPNGYLELRVQVILAARSKSYVLASKAVAEFEAAGHRADEIMLSEMIKCAALSLGPERAHSEAQAWFRRIAGMRLPVSQLSWRIYYHMILACLTSRNLPRAERWYKALEDHGKLAQAHNALIEWIIVYCCEIRYIEGAMMWFGKLAASGIRPRTSVFVSLMRMYLELGQTAEVFKIDQSMQVLGVSRSQESYELLVSAHCKARQFREARLLYEQMFSKNVRCSVQLYKTFIRAHTEEGNWRQVIKWYGTMSRERLRSQSAQYLHAYALYMSQGPDAFVRSTLRNVIQWPVKGSENTQRKAQVLLDMCEVASNVEACLNSSDLAALHRVLEGLVASTPANDTEPHSTLLDTSSRTPPRLLLPPHLLLSALQALLKSGTFAIVHLAVSLFEQALPLPHYAQIAGMADSLLQHVVSIGDASTAERIYDKARSISSAKLSNSTIDSYARLLSRSSATIHAVDNVFADIVDFDITLSVECMQEIVFAYLALGDPGHAAQWAARIIRTHRAVPRSVLVQLAAEKIRSGTVRAQVLKWIFRLLSDTPSRPASSVTSGNNVHDLLRIGGLERADVPSAAPPASILDQMIDSAVLGKDLDLVYLQAKHMALGTREAIQDLQLMSAARALDLDGYLQMAEFCRSVGHPASGITWLKTSECIGLVSQLDKEADRASRSSHELARYVRALAECHYSSDLDPSEALRTGKVSREWLEQHAGTCEHRARTLELIHAFVQSEALIRECQAGAAAKARLLYMALRQLGAQPTRAAAEELVKLCATSRPLLGLAVIVVRDITRDPGGRPPHMHVYNTLLGMLLQHKYLTAAHRLFAAIVDQSKRRTWRSLPLLPARPSTGNLVKLLLANTKPHLDPGAAGAGDDPGRQVGRRVRVPRHVWVPRVQAYTAALATTDAMHHLSPWVCGEMAARLRNADMLADARIWQDLQASGIKRRERAEASVVAAGGRVGEVDEDDRHQRTGGGAAAQL
ncbi:hypothetical protein HK105_204733 [Polyrhizophydium stewartii]|uniref:Uncharacterized protein n=1 Tax=Polyrhizophydium stewartii TaxID=2732419 RepID=A0ABR4N8D8_9FUNG